MDWFVDGNGNWQVNTYVGTPGDPQNYDFMMHPTGQLVIDTQLDPWIWGQESTEEDHMETPGNYEGELEQDLCIHFENGCRQKYVYDFTIELCFWNWPETA